MSSPITGISFLIAFSANDEFMPPHMICQLNLCLEVFLAAIRFHPNMDPNVTLQVSRLGECLTTLLAEKWFLPTVNLHVIIQFVRIGQCFVTFIAIIWFIPKVDYHVLPNFSQLCRDIVAPQYAYSCAFSGHNTGRIFGNT